MRIAICDDEKLFRNILKQYLEVYALTYSFDFVFTEFPSGDKLLSSETDFDLIFMDYAMHSINGIDTVDALRKRNDRTVVIFISSYKEVVFDSLKVQPHRFLTKPVEKDKLYEALGSFLELYGKQKYILLFSPSADKTCRIAEDTIIYAEADNMYSRVRTDGDFYVYKHTLSELEKRLDSDLFYRSHRSYLVSFGFISRYGENEIVFENGERAALVKSKHMDFQKKYFAYLKRRNMGK